MPTVLRSGPYRLFFYSNEKGEPSHIHVQRDRYLAKFWLDPIVLASSKRFASHELREIQKLIAANKEKLLEAYNGHINS